MDTEMLAAAILSAGFAAAHRQALSSGVVEEHLREKYIEFLAFVRERRARELAEQKK